MKGKKKKPAQPVKPVEDKAEVIKPEPAQPKIDPPIKIPAEVIEQANLLGIDLNQITNWAHGVDEKFAVVEENFRKIGSALTKMEPLIKLSAQIQQQQNQPIGTTTGAPPAKMGNLSGLLQFLPALLGGGGGGDAEIAQLGNQLTKTLLNQAIHNVSNPPPDPFAEIGKRMMLDYAAKSGAKAASE